jgi:hypothetical protein
MKLNAYSCGICGENFISWKNDFMNYKITIKVESDNDIYGREIITYEDVCPVCKTELMNAINKELNRLTPE